MSFAKDVMVCALLYGDHFDLHKRILDSLVKCVPEEALVYLWCNTVCQKTKDYISVIQRDRKRWSVTYSPGNVPKYIAMRYLFASVKQDGGCAYKWVVWFDDDSHITKDDWFVHMEAYIKSKQSENICYIGQPWFVHHLPGQWEFISNSKWFKGKPSEVIKGKEGVNFATGGYWWLRTDLVRFLDWADERLTWAGGDTLLGEAIRQQGLPFHKHDYGVKVNDSKRRGVSAVPAGCTDLKVRR